MERHQLETQGTWQCEVPRLCRDFIKCPPMSNRPLWVCFPPTAPSHTATPQPSSPATIGVVRNPQHTKVQYGPISNKSIGSRSRQQFQSSLVFLAFFRWASSQWRSGSRRPRRVSSARAKQPPCQALSVSRNEKQRSSSDSFGAEGSARLEGRPGEPRAPVLLGEQQKKLAFLLRSERSCS